MCQLIIFALFGIEKFYNFGFHFHIARATESNSIIFEAFHFQYPLVILLSLVLFNLVQWKIISFQKGTNIRDLRVDIRPICDCRGPKINHSLNQFRHFD